MAVQFCGEADIVTKSDNIYKKYRFLIKNRFLLRDFFS
jgi:hypothetical protein